MKTKIIAPIIIKKMTKPTQINKVIYVNNTNGVTKFEIRLKPITLL